MLTSHLKSILPQVQSRVEKITRKKFSISSFHGQIGSRNTTYVDSINEKFIGPEDFITRWIEGLMKIVEEIIL